MIRTMVRALLFVATLGAVLVSARLATLARPVDLVEVAVLTRATQFARGDFAYAQPADPAEPALMPGLPLAVMPLVQVFGPGSWQPRALALASIVVIAILVLRIVRLETASWTLAAASVGFLSLGLNLLASPPGLVRADLVMMPLVLLGFLALRLSDDFVGPLFGALALSAAWFCTTQATWYIAAAMFALALERRSRLLVFAVTLGALVGGGYVLLSRALGPWFNFGVWEQPLASLHWNPEGPLLYVGSDLLGKLGVLTLAAVLSFSLPTAPWKGKGGLWMCLGAAAIASGLLGTQTRGFGPEALVPSLVALAVLGPISMQRVTGHLSAWPGSNRMLGQGVVLTALALQFIMFFAHAQEAWRASL